jgi:hypothetical protein
MVAWLAPFVALTLTVTCCPLADARTSATIRGVPVVRQSVHGPGTALADGLSVAPGTYLIGRVFPHESASLNARGGSAVLLLTGDVQDVLDAYVSQADAVGVVLNPSCESSRRKVTCRASGASAKIAIELFLRRDASPKVSHLLFSYYQATQGFPQPFPTAPSARVRPEHVRLPRGWSPLPATGQRFGAGYVSPDLEARGLRLVKGSELVAPVAAARCATGGFVAVLRVSGEPDRVIEGYAHQFAKAGFDDQVVRATSGNGTEVLSVGSDESGAGLLYAQMLVGSRSPSYMRIERCND